MLIDTTKSLYRRYFGTDPSPFISEEFLGLVENKTDQLIRLIDENDKSIGLILGLKDGVLCSPISAPFGGFHYTHEHLLYSIVYDYLSDLKVFDNVFI